MRRVLYRPNSTVLSCRLNAPNCISSRKSAGKLFHTRGPATDGLVFVVIIFIRQMVVKHKIEKCNER